MNWILIFLVVLMIVAITDNAEAADTVTASLMSNDWYGAIIACVVVIVLAGIGLLWHASGSKRAEVLEAVTAPSSEPVVVTIPEPTYKIAECYGRYELPGITTEYGDSYEVKYSELGVYYQIKKRVIGTRRDYFEQISSHATLGEAEERLMYLIKQCEEFDKVRPSWSYRKDGTPYLG